MRPAAPHPALLADLRAVGVALAIDDFGSWYAGLGDMGDLPSRRSSSTALSSAASAPTSRTTSSSCSIVRACPRARPARRRRRGRELERGARLCELGCDRAHRLPLRRPAGLRGRAADALSRRRLVRPAQRGAAESAAEHRRIDAYAWSREVHQGARHGERLRPAPGASRGSRRRAGAQRCVTAGPASAPTACSRYVDATAAPSSWTTATPTARSPRPAATASGCSPAISSRPASCLAGSFEVGTRAGPCRVEVPADGGDITVEMGVPERSPTPRSRSARRAGRASATRSATRI